jgi:hypothetical protein
VKIIAPVMGVPAIRPEMAAKASRVSATVATAQCMAGPYFSDPTRVVMPSA